MTLNERIDLALIEEIDWEGQVVNDVVSDGFAVTRHTDADNLSFEDPAAGEFLKARLPTDGFYISYVPLQGAVYYFVWVSAYPTWRIYHAAMPCM